MSLGNGAIKSWWAATLQKWHNREVPIWQPHEQEPVGEEATNLGTITLKELQ